MWRGLGSYCAQASVVFIYPCIVLLSMLFIVNDDKEVKFDLSTKIMCLFIFVSVIVLIYTSIYVQWNPVRKPLIAGVQARYFLPILLLTAIIFNNNKITFNGKISNRYIILYLIFFNLNALSAILYTYMHGVIEYYIK